MGRCSCRTGDERTAVGWGCMLGRREDGSLDPRPCFRGPPLSRRYAHSLADTDVVAPTYRQRRCQRRWRRCVGAASCLLDSSVSVLQHRGPPFEHGRQCPPHLRARTLPPVPLPSNPAPSARNPRRRSRSNNTGLRNGRLCTPAED